MITSSNFKKLIIYHICQIKIFVRTVRVSTVYIRSKINQKVKRTLIIECYATVFFKHYPNFVSTLSQKFELSTQQTKLISYENGMVLYYNNNTMNINTDLSVFMFE